MGRRCELKARIGPIVSVVIASLQVLVPAVAQTGSDVDLSYPQGVAVDEMSNLYVADTANQLVRKMDAAGNVVTVAGNGDPGFSGDGGAATNAMIHQSTGVVVDRAGNLFIADSYNNRVRKVDVFGKITTIAGTGEPGYSGDGGPAIGAMLAKPAQVALDAVGDVYVADMINDRIRKIDTRGTITTVAGGRFIDGELLASAYYATGSNVGDGGPATTARLGYPKGVAVDRLGNVYIADTGNNRIRKVSTDGIITTIAGTGVAAYSGDGVSATRACLNGPTAVVADDEGNVWIADRGNNRVRRIDPFGNISTYAGNGAPLFLGDGGQATLASVNSPSGLVRDSNGALYIADSFNQRIRRVDAAGIITTVVGR